MDGWEMNKAAVIDGDNSAYVDSSKAPHVTKGLRHLELDDLFVIEMIQDGTCFIVNCHW
jgi:hypothetical protein